MTKLPPAKSRLHTKAKATVELVKDLKKTSRELNATKAKRLTVLVKIIEEAKANMAKFVLVMAKALKEIRDDELWRTDTADGFDAYVSKRGLVSAVYARKLIEVVEVLPKSKTLPYPVEKVWELTRYAKDSSRRGGLSDLLAKDATINDRPVSDLSADEIHNHRMKLAENVKKRAVREPERKSHEKRPLFRNSVTKLRNRRTMVSPCEFAD